jgi:hypothetical protein
MSGYDLPGRGPAAEMPRELVEALFAGWSPPSRRITMEDILGARFEAPAVLLHGMPAPPLDNWGGRAVDWREFIEPSSPMRKAA